ncbi:hypothetical protein, partial [uncultured Hymenobacter sp.]|uniref:hypothetical protein n=1 Tax=uncultured Hymenobacter sp. TaxID=170016 RepID=UPI0035CC36EB
NPPSNNVPVVSSLARPPQKCFSLLDTTPPLDYAYDLVRVIELNTSPEDAQSKWSTRANSFSGNSLTRWLQYGLRLSVLNKLPVQELAVYLNDNDYLNERIRVFIKAKRWDALEISSEIYERTVKYVLDSGEDFGNSRIRKNPYSLELFTSLINRSKYTSPSHRSSSGKLSDSWLHSGWGRSKTENEAFPQPGYLLSNKCDKFSALAEELAELTVSEWTHELAPWERLTQAIQQEFGDVWALKLFAVNAAATLKLKEPISKEYNALFDSDKSLCQRVRYATEHNSSVAWWNKQLEFINSQEETMLFLLVLFTWATPAVVKSLLNDLDPLLVGLPDKEWYKLFDAIQANMWKGPGQRNKPKSQELVNALPENISERTVLCVAVRLETDAEHELYRTRLLNYTGYDPKVLDVCQWFATRTLFSRTDDPDTYLSLIQRGYKQDIVQDEYWSNQLATGFRFTLDLNVAKTIAARPEDFPSFLLMAAEQICHTDTASKIVPVGTIARDEDWAFA